MNRTQRYHHRLAFMCMLAAPGEGGSGGGGKTLEQQLADARTELSTANEQVTSVTAERDQARNELSTANSEVQRLTNQFNTATETANTANAEVNRLKGELSTVTTDRDQLKGKLTSADTNVTRLETLCGVKGIDPKQIPPNPGEPASKLSTADFDARIKSAKTPSEEAKITAEFEKAFAEGRIA